MMRLPGGEAFVRYVRAHGGGWLGLTNRGGIYALDTLAEAPGSRYLDALERIFLRRAGR